MSFTPKPGCPMCSIVSAAADTTQCASSSILFRDGYFTAYRETLHPLSSRGHLIIAFNLHVPSIYTLSSSDLPLLVNVRNHAIRLLTSVLSGSSPAAVDQDSSQQTTAIPPDPSFHIGFITPPFKDSKIPVTDHLHAHAYIAPADLMGWWRGIAYGPLAWYAIDDLIAEIRETVSNNRIKSGYENRQGAPIDLVPHAGARAGTADGIETTEASVAHRDSGVHVRLSSLSSTPASTPPQSPRPSPLPV